MTFQDDSVHNSSAPEPIVTANPDPGSPEFDPYATIPSKPDPRAFLPEDLRIPWSWFHLASFIGFAIVSLILIQGTLAIYFKPTQQLNQKQYEEYLLSQPQFTFGTMILWYGFIFIFLYATLTVLLECPFWPTLGWKKLAPKTASRKSHVWIFLLSGAALAIFVAIASSQIKTPEEIPIEQIMKSRTGALLLMTMAVLVAPLVEETIFRGYLYPFLAEKLARLVKYFGVEPAMAGRVGISSSILVTGILFGLVHGQQLGWTSGLVALLSLVGILFTLVRARTGSVFASYLMHLGYNGLFALASFIGTRGFTYMNPK